MKDVEYKANCVLRTRIAEGGRKGVAVEIRPVQKVTEEALVDMGMKADEAKNFIADQVDCGRIKEIKPDASGDADLAAQQEVVRKAQEEADKNTNKGGGQQGNKK